jgi:hypothetical protein
MKYKIYVQTGEIMLYTIWVTTGESPDRGANARLFMELWGTKGKKDEFFLGRPVDYLPDAVLTDVFEVDIPDLGDIYRMCIRHNKSGSYPDWFINEVRIVREDGKAWHFSFNQWLSEEQYPYRLTLCREPEGSVDEEEDEGQPARAAHLASLDWA